MHVLHEECSRLALAFRNYGDVCMGGQFGETLRRSDHPVCAASVASRHFLMAQPPLLCEEGNITRPVYRLTACLGFRISFCTRQLFISATKTTSSDGHASPCGQLNCFGPRPDSPSIPRILPSNVSL